jgi:hypothetical protein
MRFSIDAPAGTSLVSILEKAELKQVLRLSQACHRRPMA